MRSLKIGLLAVVVLTPIVRAADHRPERSLVGEEQAAASPTPRPPRPEKSIETIEQQQMTIGEMTEFFSNLKIGTALRLTYSNGADFAGNFEGREPGRALIYCRRGLAPVRQVPLRKVVDAYVITSSTLTIRIHRTDFTWKEK